MGRLIVVGLTHHVAPLDVRERVAIDEERWRSVAPATLPTVLLSTCNRVEVYAWSEGPSQPAVRRIERALASAAGLGVDELKPYLRISLGREAVLHLVRVTAGLDSLVIGEDQIRSQVRDALRQAEAADATLPGTLRGVFQRAAEAARRVRGSTRLAHHPSIAAAGIHAAAHLVPNGLAGQQVVVLGAGIMAKAALASLAGAGAGVYLVNRTASRAEQVASRAGSHVLSAEFEHLPELLIQSALLVGATASRQPVVGLETVATVLASRAGRPLVILDLAVPRDVDPRVRELPGVSMIDLDDLERLCPLDSAARQAELQRAEVLAAQEADHLVKWVRHRASSPAIVELRAVAETIRAAELRRAARHLKDLTPEQAAAIEALTVGIVNKLLHGPTLTLRDGAARPGGVTRSRRLVQRVLRLGPTRRGRTAHSEN